MIKTPFWNKPLFESLENEQLKKKESQSKNQTTEAVQFFVDSWKNNRFFKTVVGSSGIVIWSLLWVLWYTSIVDTSNTQEKHITTGTQEDITNVLVIDTTAVLDEYKQTLSDEERQKFEQLSLQQQREHIQSQ